MIFLTKNNHSLRAKRRLLQLSRTIADAHDQSNIEPRHISLAIQLSQHANLKP